MTELVPVIVCDEDELHMGYWVKYPKVLEQKSGGYLLDLSDRTWFFEEGEVKDGAVRMVVSHALSHARFRLDMRPSGHWTIDGEEPAMVGRQVPAALKTKNVEPLSKRARALLAKRPNVPEEVTRALDARSPAALLFRPFVGKDGASEVEDTALYWLLYELDGSLVAAAPALP